MEEISEAERKKEKRIKRNEDNLRDLWEKVKCLNDRIIGVSEGEDKKQAHEKILEEIIVENFPKMGKEIATHVQETQSPKQSQTLQVRREWQDIFKVMKETNQQPRLLYPARISFKY